VSDVTCRIDVKTLYAKGILAEYLARIRYFKVHTGGVPIFHHRVISPPSASVRTTKKIERWVLPLSIVFVAHFLYHHRGEAAWFSVLMPTALVNSKFSTTRQFSPGTIVLFHR
jgi:hypothetical protein